MPALIFWGAGLVLVIIILAFAGLGVAMLMILGGPWCLLGVAPIALALFVAGILWRVIIKPSLGGNGPGVNSGS